MKKLSLMAMVLMLSFSLSSVAMAGSAKGLETAPGQASNFSKGVTTTVTTSQVVHESTTTEVQKSSVDTIEAKNSTSAVESTTVDTRTEKHPTKDLYTDVTTTTNWLTTTTSTWDETTTATTTTTTVTPITITETITTTTSHQGAPGSNGKILSQVPTSTYVVVEGTPVVSSVTETSVTVGDITTNTTKVATSTVEEKNPAWAVGQK